MKVSVILPARNEQELIEKTVKDIAGYIKKRGYSFEILVVVNGSEDATEEILLRIIRRIPQVKILKSKPGYGYASRKGLKEAKGDYVIIYNVDFYDFRLIDYVDVDMKGNDIIIGSKLAKGAKDERPFLRHLVSLMFNYYLKIFYGFKGTDTHGIKLIRKTAIDEVLPKCSTTSGIFDTEFILKSERQNFKRVDLPVNISEKRPPRFGSRSLQTFIDLFELSRALRKRDERGSLAKPTPILSQELEEKEHFDSGADIYDKTYGYDQKFTKYKITKKCREFVKFVKQNNLENSRILELGCGTGEYTRHIAAMLPKAKIVALDISSKVLVRARLKCRKLKNIDFLNASAYKVPLREESVEVICGFYVLHHLNIRRTNEEVERLIKPGGIVFFYEPNILNPIVFLIKSTPFLKKKVGDSPGEWGINPLKTDKYFPGLEVIKITQSEYLFPLEILPDKLLVFLDRITARFTRWPLFRYIGGSVQLCLKKP
ncbi:MAG TPA: methyltransferase domain-containing protein [Patescibacteria group bacterium]|uniref:Glycosyltransferase 2-like domain-containing protein n=1 Tax=Candidatus Woesebacteria bacterium RBG_13_46_13 TaxID=1802479 RepID=A0A1F7X3V7_9BACT|nr:MAG: hypothetical protein A2Y68_00250 [Candidatus Woesebacteria bacterium RBG_13_46_13]HJX58999.1 methyltransferase domain-containing protein [Patescibacteria group bacterium]